MNLGILNFSYFILALFITSCAEDDIREIYIEEDKYVGNISFIDGDTIFEGSVQHFVDDELYGVYNYHNNVLDGESLLFHSNGKISVRTNYFFGIQNGDYIIYDTFGNIIHKSYNYYGRTLGGIYYYSDNIVRKYRFNSFDGFNIYNAIYKYNGRDTVLEEGNLLNYLTNIIQDNGTYKIDLFLYLINPNHKELTYKIEKCDLITNDTMTVYQVNSAKYGVPFVTIKLDLPKKNEKYLIRGEAYYPKYDTIVDFIEKEHMVIDIPKVSQ